MAEFLQFHRGGEARTAAARAGVGAPERVDTAYFHRLFRGMRCGILTVDRDGRLVMANDLAQQILELEQIPQPGLPVEDALDDYPQLAQILRESFQMSQLPNRAEIDVRCRSQKGKTIGFTLSMVPGPEGDGHSGAAIFFKDLTHVEHKEEQERLKDRLAALGQMAANLAHEIRNPLASIEVSCSLMKRRLGQDGPGRDLLDKIISEVRRLNGTITSSLEFVRPISHNPAPAAIEPLLDAALRVAAGRRGNDRVTVERRFAGLPPLLCDRDQLRQVFENLLINAFEAMPEGGTLTVETSRTPAPASTQTPYRPAGSAARAWPEFDHYAVVTVRDTGVGIGDEHLDKLFYPFFTTKKHGSGVGLAMAKKIVDSHRGLIDIASEPGQGTEFTVRLPLVVGTEEG